MSTFIRLYPNRYTCSEKITFRTFKKPVKSLHSYKYRINRTLRPFKRLHKNQNNNNINAIRVYAHTNLFIENEFCSRAFSVQFATVFRFSTFDLLLHRIAGSRHALVVIVAPSLNTNIFCFTATAFE